MDKFDLKKFDIILRNLYDIREWIRCRAAGLVPQWDDQIVKMRNIEDAIKIVRFTLEKEIDLQKIKEINKNANPE